MSEQTLDTNPSSYIEKVSLITGEVIDDPIEPKQLLVGHHRDYHPADVQARRFMSRLLDSTQDESLVRQRMREIRQTGVKISERIGKIVNKDTEVVSKTLFGLKQKEYYFRFRKAKTSPEDIERRMVELKGRALMQQVAARDEESLNIRVLLTGGTGFVGQEIMWQAAHDPQIVEMVVVIRPKVIKDRKTGEVIETLSPATRGQALLRRLWLEGTEAAKKFRFVAGDIEEKRFGISNEDYAELQQSLTHVIHCAASVAFDDPYDLSFRANVLGTVNALDFSLGLQNAEGSPFVAHLSIETSYIHGRQVKSMAREDEIVFPRNFYNNFYELTKAIASLETERYMLDEGLRVVQLCPAIVIGESRGGNNRGDTKVVNAPVNVFGRAHEALTHKQGNVFDRTRAAALARLACIFPGDPSAQLNIIPVDRVVEGIVAALRRPESVGERVHLATDDRLTAQNIRDIVGEELGVDVKLADPTTHRNVTLPVLTKLLTGLKQERLATALEKLGTIFGGYSEWGQPIHQVGNDVRLLGLAAKRPISTACFRMLCRHNRYVQNFGRVRDLDEVSRREKLWWDLM
ncbi:MAG: SDR family oxidoreductase, partial [Acidobacteriota bacterium]